MVESNENIKTKRQFINLITHSRLFNEISNNKGEILIFDFRKVEDFQKKSFEKYSVNFPYNHEKLTFEYCSKYNISDWTSTFCNDENKRVIARMKRFFILFVISDDKPNQEEIERLFNSDRINFEEEKIKDNEALVKSILLYKTLKKNKIREVSFFKDSYKKFLNDFIFIGKFNKVVKSFFNDPYPSTVIDFKLFVGDESHVKNIELLKHFKITHIVNATQHVPNYFIDNGIKYLNIPVEDNDLFKFQPYFNSVFNFIDSAFFDENIHPNYNYEKTEMSMFCCPFSKKEKENNDFIENEIINGEENKGILKEKVVSFTNKEFYNDDDSLQKMNLSQKTNSHSNPRFDFRKSSLTCTKENYFYHFFESPELPLKKDVMKNIEKYGELLKNESENIYLKNILLQEQFKLFDISHYEVKGEKNNNRVLVHCSLGVSRSSCVIICYLMRKFQLIYNEAYEILNFHRNKAVPIQSFVNELENYGDANKYVCKINSFSQNLKNDIVNSKADSDYFHVLEEGSGKFNNLYNSNGSTNNSHSDSKRFENNNGEYFNSKIGESNL